MKKFLTLLAASLLGCATQTVAQVSNDNEEGVYKIEKHSQRYRDGEIIVKFKTGTANAKSMVGTTSVTPLTQALSAIGASSVEKLMPLSGGQNVGAKAKAYNGSDVVSEDMDDIYRMAYDTAKVQSVEQAIDAVKAIDGVEYAEPNYIVYALGEDDVKATSCWDDPLCPNQWGLEALKLPNMHDKPHVKTKRNIIAILDTGVDITHPDLVDNIWTNEAEASGAKNSDDDGNGFKDDIHGWDFINNTANIRDNNGHGTHCAGIAAAVSGNSLGVVGADPEAYIMPITVMQSDGTGDIATIIKGLDYASANGADVISMSLGTYSTSTAFEQALGKAYANAVLVAAAGNDGLNIYPPFGAPVFPAAYSFVLGVQSSGNEVGALAGYSNYDPDGPVFTSFGEDKLYNYELRAPGSNIMSTYPYGKYKALNGTSMACPFAAGAISCLLRVKEYENKDVLFGDLIHASGNGNLNILAAYNITEADRHPSLELVTYTIDDGKTISDRNDGDGCIDAGETVDIYPVIRNSWGQAKNIKTSIKLAENEDPTIASIINTNVDFGSELSSYAKATSTNPLRIKINDDCVDGRHISFVIGATCDNISNDLAQDFILTAENVIEIGGIIDKDTTLYPIGVYKVSGQTAIKEGVTVNVMPGVELKGGKISVFGKLNIMGAPGKLVELGCDLGGSGKKIHISYAHINELLNHIPQECSFDNCVIEKSNAQYNTFEKCNMLASANPYNTVSNSNVFSTVFGFTQDGKLTWSTCNIINTHITWYCYAIDTMYVNANYYGSGKENIVRKNCITDYYSGINWGIIDLSNMLTRPSSEAHGIVWKVLVDGVDPQDEADKMSPLGVGKHKFEVYFNRPMNTAVTPTISMGVRSPYTQVSISEDGSWSADSTIYTAYKTITGKTASDGINRIYVYGAQDDEYFEIPEEKYRFNVNVQAAGSMSTGLMATEGLGKVTLDWETTETNFDDLLGFNVYRGLTDSTCTTRVNTELIEPGAVQDGKMEQQFIDYDVTPGTTYYYIVKEMSTDLSQNEVSNPVACTPKTAEKGDANGSMAVDVADVVTEINYLTNQDPQPFIFEAADVNSDNNVNILDVVGTVNIITTPSGAKAMTADNTASYTVEDGILYVESPVALGGVQVSINASKESVFYAMDGLAGMEQTGAWMSDNKYLFLAYSMSGKSIPSGKQALLNLGNADATNMVLSDARGKNIVAINGSATAIEALPFGIENSKNTTVRYYDMMGRSVSKSAAQQKGFYIESIMVDGKCVKSYKILNK